MSRTLARTLLTIALTISFAPAAEAQSKNEFGLLMGLPAAFGVDWELSSWLAVRPDVSFSTSSFSWTATAGLSGVLHVKKWDTLRLYVSPRFAHTIGRFREGATITQTAVSGSVGTQLALVPRLSLFAETGVTYTHQRNYVTGSGRSWGNRGAIGVIVFF